MVLHYALPYCIMKVFPNFDFSDVGEDVDTFYTDRCTILYELSIHHTIMYYSILYYELYY